MEVLPDEFVGARVGVAAPTGHLFHVEHAIPPFIQGKDLITAPPDFFGQMGEGARRKVAVLAFTLCKVNGAAVEPAGGPGLEAAHLEPKLLQAVA